MDAKIVELLKDAKTEEEAMKILEDQKIELSNEELEELRGGSLAGIECITISVSMVSTVVATIRYCK